MNRGLYICCLALVVSVGGAIEGEAGAPRFPLFDAGTEDIIDYEQYGSYKDEGTTSFRFIITNRTGLAKASGVGVDPNADHLKDPEYQAALKAGKLDGDWWKHVQSPRPQLDFFVWCEAGEDPGVRQFYIGKILERSGHYMQALKAYRAAMVLYPDAVAWSASGEFSWSIAEGAWNQMVNLIRKHPEMGVQLVGANVIARTFESGQQISVTPGVMVRVGEPASKPELKDVVQVKPAFDVGVQVEANVKPAADAGVQEEANVKPAADAGVQVEAIAKPSNVVDPEAVAEVQSAVVDPNQIIQTRGTGTVQLVQYATGDWQMLVEGKPYFVHGVVYDPTKTGVVPWEWNWMWADDNTNGTVDICEVWFDKNKNNIQDDDEPVVGDFALLKEMGCNTIKTYEGEHINNLLLRKMYHDHGIRVILGDFAGAYCHDSGASWEEGTDYNSRDQKKSIKEAIRRRVEKVRGEPWLLAYILGNENNMPSSLFVNATRTNANKYPEAYARFLQELADMIHGLDPNHPVGVGNLMTGLVEYYAKYAPALDFIGVNCYIGPDGFGSTWEKVKATMDRPVLITEYGCDSYYTDRGPDEEGQSGYHMGNWSDIDYNRRGGSGSGNSIGGCLFEWVDEWWKDNKMKQVDGVWVYKDPLDNQHTKPTGDMAFPDGKTQEEWLGITGQGSGKSSPFQRVPKKAYYAYQEVWCHDLETEKE